MNCAGRRATPDLALDADPRSGVSVYDSVPYEDHFGWFTIGGTSASTVMVAAEAAVTGADVNAKYVYASPANIPFRDITAGSNGYPALPGYDLATGLGAWSYTLAPNGLAAMSVSGSVTLSLLEQRLRHGGQFDPQSESVWLRPPRVGHGQPAVRSCCREDGLRLGDRSSVAAWSSVVDGTFSRGKSMAGTPTRSDLWCYSGTDRRGRQVLHIEGGVSRGYDVPFPVCQGGG